MLDRIEARAEVLKPDLFVWLAGLSPDERAAVERVAREWTDTALERFIRDEGVRVSSLSIRKWKATL